MCEPITLAAIAVGGATISAVGSVAGGIGEADAARRGAGFLDMQAGDARVRGEVEASQYRRLGSQMMAQQRVAAGVSGVEGKSVDDLMFDTALMSERDAEQVRTNAAREAWGYSVQAEELRQHGRTAIPRGVLGGTGTLLGGLAQGLSMSRR